MRKEFIQLLDARRIALGLRKQDLANVLGVSSKTVSQWYNDESIQLSANMINRISDKLGIDFKNISPVVLGTPIKQEKEYTMPIISIPMYSISNTTYNNNILKGTILNNIIVPCVLVNNYENSFALYIDIEKYNNIGINKGDIVIASNNDGNFFIVAINGNLQINYKLAVDDNTLVISGVSAHIKKI